MSGARTGARQLLRLRAALSDRDLGVLRSLEACRYLSAGQLQRWHFPVGSAHQSSGSAARIARRVLARLEGQRLLVRLGRRIGGVRAGSSGYVYGLGGLGQRVLASGGTRRRPAEPSLTFLEHTLAVGEVLVGLVEAARGGQLELLDYETEPDCWRRYLAAGGARETLKPDLAVVLGVGAYEQHWFIEVDRGTAHLPTLLRKCQQYERYYRSGQEQQARGLFPRIAWLTTPAREGALADLIAADAGLPDWLFVVADFGAARSVLAGAGAAR